MTFLKYIKDRRNLILFYIFIITFISTMIYLTMDISSPIDNLLYINLVAYITFILYLVIGYLFKKPYYNNLKDLTNNDSSAVLEALPSPLNNETALLHDVIKDFYKKESKNTEKLYLDKLENMDFITSWVHEVKTPIAVCRLTIENSFDKPKEDVLDSIDEELTRIDNYIEQALYYSKIDDFSKDYFVGEVQLKKVVNETIKKNAKAFIAKRISLNIHDTENTVLTDKKWLVFILNQVIGNSLKYTDLGGTIEIFSEIDGKETRLIIKDNGAGIKKEDLNRVFHKGFTGFNGRTYNKSTGMGLYLAKKMCEKLSHDISIESSYGEYTKVILHFPKIFDYFKVTKV